MRGIAGSLLPSSSRDQTHFLLQVYMAIRPLRIFVFRSCVFLPSSCFISLCPPSLPFSTILCWVLTGYYVRYDRLVVLKIVLRELETITSSCPLATSRRTMFTSCSPRTHGRPKPWIVQRAAAWGGMVVSHMRLFLRTFPFPLNSGILQWMLYCTGYDREGLP